MNKLKYHFLGGLVFLGTIVFGYIGYTTYNNLATQVDGATITRDIWNEVITTINNIGAKTDSLETKTSNIYNNGGNIGIGVSNPTSKLQISSLTTDITQNITPSNSALYIRGSEIGYGLAIGNSNAASRLGKAFIQSIVNDTSVNPNDILINPKGGNVGIGTTSPNGKLDVAGGLTLGNYRYWGIRDNSAGRELVIEKHNGGAFADANIKFRIGSTGIVYGTSFSATSDERLKKNICSIESGIDIIKKLRGVTFNWKDKSLEQTKQYGFIAQELEKIVPDLVKTDSKGYKSVNYDGVIPILVKSIQEQEEKINNLESENLEILKKLEELENKIK